MFKNITLLNFRNLSEISLEFGKNVNIFIGDNGQGKTNLLEALYFLSTGNSFRYAENQNLISNGKNEAILKTKIFHGDFDYDVQISILKSRKNVFIQGKKATSSELLQKFPVVIFSPESLAAIKEGADQRRQLLDDLLISFDKRNADLTSEFRKCLKTRNRVLKDYQAGLRQKNETLGILESLNPIFVELGSKLTHQRVSAMKALLPELNNAMQSISRDRNVDILVEYVISDVNALNFDLENIKNLLKNRVFELSEAELSFGASLVGPQKHDIKFLYNQNDSRFYCSQGQQRALILSFKMAQIVYHRRAHGAYPVLMLDDVLSELDSNKREALISFLTKIETQIFITTTDINLPEDMGGEGGSGKCSVHSIKAGRIS